MERIRLMSSEVSSQITSQVAGRIRELRRQKGLSARQLADLCVAGGVSSLSRSTIAKIESGVRRFVTLEETVALAGALGITPGELLSPRPTVAGDPGNDNPGTPGALPAGGYPVLRPPVSPRAIEDGSQGAGRAGETVRNATVSAIDYPPVASWVVAIHASSDSVTPIGSGVVIDVNHVLTCAHVVTDEMAVRDRLWVAFPMADDPSRLCRVARVEVSGTPLADLAILGLDEAIPPGVTEAPLRFPEARDLPMLRWSALGFSPSDPLGNTTGGIIGAALGYGWIRLDNESRHGLGPGFSGSALWSPDYQAVIGVVGRVNDRGDRRAITMYQADAEFPGQNLRDRNRSSHAVTARPGGHLQPYFFLSYARTPKRDPADREDPDRWVYKLYKDLCGAILQMTDAQPGEAGFMDRENKLGTAWSPEYVAALETSRVFVPLYSRRYFESDYCGREWFAFARREVNRSAQGQQVLNPVVPALWTGLDWDRVPRIARQPLDGFPSLGERYSTRGLYGLMKLQSYRADYQRAVHHLAEQIVAAADENVSYVAEPDLQQNTRIDVESLPSAFGPMSLSRITNSMQIAVLAPDTSTLSLGRDYSYYGSVPHAWSPYQPDYSIPIADYAVNLAQKCLDIHLIVGTMEEIQESLLGSRPVPPTLVLVDPFVVFLPEFEEQLRMLNGLEESWVSVLIPWNTQDREINAVGDELRERLIRYLGHKLSTVPRRCQMAANGIPTLQDFGQLLPEMLTIMAKRFRKEARVYPPTSPLISRPRLLRANPEVRETPADPN
jgi:FxsC-like protein